MGGQRAQKRNRALHRNPCRAQRHQRQRNGQPAFFKRKGQRQRQRAECAGGEQRNRNRQSRPVVALGENLGRDAIGRREHHRQDRKRDRAIEMRDAGIERDQQRQRREHGGGRPHHRHDGAGRAALRQETRGAEPDGEDRRGHQVQRDRAIGGGRSDAGQRPARQYQHVRIAAHRPFGKHDEDQQGRGADRAGGGRCAPCDQ
jgi:hypothetical protein